MDVPSFKEDHISQLPALELLMKLDYQYLPPRQALDARGGRNSNVLLEAVLKDQLKRINKIEYKGKEFEFSDASINTAVLAIRDLPLQDNFLETSKALYELLTLGKSIEQNVLGDKKSFSFKYIDWQHPENNVYHVTEEFAVLRTGRADTYRPDIVLFVNGIPLVVIECKSPMVKSPVDVAIEQQLRNQQDDGIRPLYHYAGIVMGLAVNEAKYATIATPVEFWNVWKEQFRKPEDENLYLQQLQLLKDKQLPADQYTELFKDRYWKALQDFMKLDAETKTVTEQDKLLYNLCRKDRLLDIIYHFTLYDNGEKKIARYQQYIAVQKTMDRVVKVQPDGTRQGGVIWHTQGSGKSLTMVMLAQRIAMHPRIKHPKIVLVTDRIDLDDQIADTFKKCDRPVRQASTGAHLAALLSDTDDAIITTIINKFEAAVRAAPPFESSNIFILVDEGHRSQYGTFNVRMRQVFPNACFIAFTGTPLMKQERSTADKFGGIIDTYSIKYAVEDKAVVPILYEGRHNMMNVNAKAMDKYFEHIAGGLSQEGKVNLKRKFSARNKIVQSQGFIESTAWDIVEHFTNNIAGTGFKGQLVAPNKLSAVRYRKQLKDIGKVSVELLISSPDTREGEKDAFEESDAEVKIFWGAMMDKYGSAEKYEKAVINGFKKQDDPRIIIVVDKLLTGFDAPVNQVLYLTRNLQEHTLLQAVARVNRLYPGKKYGFVIDYYGNLENLDGALKMYSGDDEFDEKDVAETLLDISQEIRKLPQAHSEVWDIFKTVTNKYDEPAYEELLSDRAVRECFYEKLSAFALLLKLALSSLDFMNNTSDKQVEKYKADVAFFLKLRVSVKRRYFDDIDFRAYEAQVQKLIDKHITAAGEVLSITGLVNIFDKEEREMELERITGKAAKADHIAHRTIKAISIRMNDDPVYYKKLSELIQETIDAYHAQRIGEARYLEIVRQCEDNFLNDKRDNVPDELKENPVAMAFYNIITEELKTALLTRTDLRAIATDIAKGIEAVVTKNVFDGPRLVIDWQKNSDVKGRMSIEIDDLLFDMKNKYDLEVDFEHFDRLIADSIKVAEARYR